MRLGPAISHGLAVLAIALLTGSTAQAQSAPRDELSASRFSPAPGAGNFGMVDGAAVGGHMTPTVGLLIDYAHRPLVLFEAVCTGETGSEECDLEGFEREIVSYQVTGNLTGSLSLGGRVQLGLVVPVVGIGGEGYHASRGIEGADPVRLPGGDAFALGDPELSAKVKLVGTGAGDFMLAAVVYGTAPVGKQFAEGRGLGNSSFTAGGHLAAEYRVSLLRLALNVGGVYRPTATLLSTESGPELTYGAAGEVRLTSLFSVSTELTGATRLSSQLDENPLEARAYGNLNVGDLRFSLGGGAGLLGGSGVPNFRVVGGALFVPDGTDSDGDGVGDKHDQCSAEPEDLDGYQDDDGCPEADNDADGLPDEVDRCPNEPEDMDGLQDEDGCPDRDNDGDGVEDGYDSCPDEPEDMDGDRDHDGCPDSDRDRDGIDDDKDQCPDKMEDTDGFGDEDGCPEVDFDGDGLPDEDDMCPDEPEDKDGVDDEDGCPDP